MKLLIDGSSLLWRTHYANQAQGRATIPNNIHAFLRSLKSYATMYNSKDIYIAWDKKACVEKNFRQTDTGGTYKGNRNKEEAQIVYDAQPAIADITYALGCKNLYPWVMEADDIIAWLSQTTTDPCIIITSDQDMLQLIRENVCVFQPRKKITIDHGNFESIMGMPLKHYLPYKAILGDKSDNITGIYGYGPVGSKKLARQWVDDRSTISPEHTMIIEKNITLMDLSSGYNMAGKEEVEYYQKQIEELAGIDYNHEAFVSYCNDYNFKSILKDINNWKGTFETPYLLKFLNNLDF